MDYKDCARQLVKATRGKRSQEFVNRRLGYDFNQVYRYEKGIKRITWLEFIDLVKSVRSGSISQKAFLTKYFNGNLSYHYKEFFEFIESYLGPNDDLHREIGFSKTQISNWKKGKSSPYLDQMLCIFNRILGVMENVVMQFTGGESIPFFKDLTELKLNWRKVSLMHPEASVVINYLTLKPGNWKSVQRPHLSNLLGRSEEDLEKIFQKLIQYELIIKRGTKYDSNLKKMGLTFSRFDPEFPPKHIKHMEMIERVIKGDSFRNNQKHMLHYTFQTNDKRVLEAIKVLKSAQTRLMKDVLIPGRKEKKKGLGLLSITFGYISEN